VEENEGGKKADVTFKEHLVTFKEGREQGTG